MTGPKLRVAISGFAGAMNPEPGTGVARALREGWPEPIAIEALGYDPWMTGAWAPGLADGVHLMPLVADDDEATLGRILEIHESHPIDALIPCLDLEVHVFSRLAPRLRKAGIRTLLPPADAVVALVKTALPAFCHQRGILTPKTIHVLNINHVPFYADQLGYPLMVKGTVAGAKRVENSDEAVFEARRLAEKWGNGVLLQELIYGDEYDVGMVAGRDGSLLGQVAVRKLVTTDKGKCAIGAVVDDPSLLKEASNLLSMLDWAGPLELEFIRIPATGQLYLLEINCRFPSWIMLSHWAECNLPVLLLREILEMPTDRLAGPKPGTTFVRDVAEVSVSAKKISNLQRFKTVTGRPDLAPAPKKSDKGLRVAVTGISALDVVMSGLGVARALRREPEITAIYGLCYGPYDTGLYRNDLFDAVYRLPDTEDPEALLERLRMIRQDVDIDVILPCLDVEVPRFIEIKQALSEIGIQTLLPSAESVARTQKLNLFIDNNRLDWGGFRIPRTEKIWTLQGVERAAQLLGFPMVIKNPISGARVVRNIEEARVAWMALRKQENEETLAQTFVAGDEFAVAAVCGNDHEFVDFVTIKKHLQDGSGSTWSAGLVDEPELVESVKTFLRDLEWRGPAEAEFLRSSFDERFYLIEVNPRSTAWISYTADCNANLPLQTVLAAVGRPPLVTPSDGDAIFMRYCEELPVRPSELATFTTKGRLVHG